MKKKPILFLLLFFLLRGFPVSAQDKPYDFLIKDALVFDGKSVHGVKGDVALKGPFIVRVGKIDSAQARDVVNAKGLALAPGFIDAHTHSDFNPLVYADLQNKILQGVTTEVIGNCGMSAAPVLGEQEKQIRKVWAREGVVIPASLPWKTFLEYRGALESKGLETNFVGLIGHGNLRTAVTGLAARRARPEEIEAMKKLLANAMEEGAYGISYGLVYLPGIFAEEEELVELCREAGRGGGICAFHMRSEGSGLLPAIQEAIRIGEKAGAPIQISHLKAAGKNNWGKIDKAFRLIEQARARGLKVTSDVYPYTGSYAELGVVLPDPIYQREDRIALFRDPAKRGELLAELKSYYLERKRNWAAIVIAATADPRYQRFEGKTIEEAAHETKKTPEEFLIEILADTGFEVSAFSFSQTEEVVGRVVQKPYVAIGSDSIADGTRRPHPRAYGTFPKVFREYVNEKKEFGTGEAVRKMTSLEAEHFGIKNRGRVQEGYFADLVLFDPVKIADRATYDNPKVLGPGIAWVFVNGRPVVREGKATGEKNGRFLVHGNS